MQFVSAQSERVYNALHPNGDPFNYKPSKNRELEIMGLLLWATEGDKTQLSLANGNASIIQKYLEFLRNVCRLKESLIRAVIHCHDSTSYSECLKYWSQVTHIPPSRFKKPFIKPDKGGNRNYPYGIVRVVACNQKLQLLFKERLTNLGLSLH
ncbi:MAG: hypothetical protein Q8P73_03630 [bacterium]|nr:hypothetical protein [bacterium]